ncbi:MAG: hypothetical protein QF706_09555, partial [Roseibacillus sp.]|nr:hypothetical protein [Roseibacillus sp.]
MNNIIRIWFGIFFSLAMALSGHAQNNSTSGLSAATKRLRAHDSRNELYTRFRYQPVKGLGYEKGVSRRDPSSI